MMLKKLTLVLCLLAAVAGAAGATDLQLRTTPCRLYDSRNIGVGSKITNATILAWGNAGSAQGGEASCGAPETAEAVVVNVISFEATTPGHGRLWPYQATEPLASSINVTAALAENTGLMVNLGTDGKLSWNAVYSGHLVIDLAGWLDSDGAGVGRDDFDAPRHRRVLTIVNAPFAPGAVVPGDRFLVAASGTVGAFAGHENEWVYWTGSAWVFEEPGDGDLAFDASTGLYYRYRALGSAGWAQLALVP